ncbi:hypothetical protein [Azospirillum argentinense]
MLDTGAGRLVGELGPVWYQRKASRCLKKFGQGHGAVVAVHSTAPRGAIRRA